MIFGFPLPIFVAAHVAISLIAIASGLIVLAGLLASKRLIGWTGLFLFTTFLTSATGFMFPINGFTPSLGLGVVSLVALVLRSWRSMPCISPASGAGSISRARSPRFISTCWRWSRKAFQKLPALHAVAPT